MNPAEDLLARFGVDPSRYPSAVGFAARAADVEVQGGRGVFVVRGTTDQRWVYGGGGDLQPLLRGTDTHFAALEPAAADALGAVVWRRTAKTFVLGADVMLPQGPLEAVKLSADDAPLINIHWEHKDPGSLDYLRACLSRDPAFGVRIDGALVGWELIHDDGAMGAAFVLPAFRRRGVMRTIQAAMVSALRQRGQPVFKHVSLENRDWLAAQQPAGWSPAGIFEWLELSSSAVASAP